MCVLVCGGVALFRLHAHRCWLSALQFVMRTLGTQAKDQFGDTPIHRAVFRGNTAATKVCNRARTQRIEWSVGLISLHMDRVRGCFLILPFLLVFWCPCGSGCCNVRM